MRPPDPAPPSPAPRNTAGTGRRSPPTPEPNNKEIPLTSYPLDSVANVKASAATLHELADHLTTVDTDQPDQLLEHLM
ncbi:hypothetical protein ACFTWP_41860, partial [Kitasatospora sp. NPDC057015]